MGVFRAGVTLGLVILLSVVGLGQGCPTVVVIIPEDVIISRIPRPIPDPAAETAIIKHFISYGFRVVDQHQVRAIRMADPNLIARAYAGDPQALAMLTDRFVADILVLGEAVATVEVFEALRVPGQPRLQDGRARVEVRAIEARTGRILAADAVHTGGVDFSAELAGKRALERGGDKIACRLAESIARSYGMPRQCFSGCRPSAPAFGVLRFENQSGVRVRGRDIEQLMVTAVETAVSERGCRTSQALAADYIVTGVITEWAEIRSPPLNIPLLGLLFRGVVCRVTVDVRVLDLATAEFQAFLVTVNLTGSEVLGLRFGAGPVDVARAVGRQIASRMSAQCRGW